MDELRLHLFGSLRVSPPRVAAARLGRPAKALLAFLLLHRRRLHPREVLSGMLWGDASEERARSCLSTALWRLRQVLEPPSVPRGTFLVTTTAGEVGFNTDAPHWVDVAAYEGVARRVTASPFHDSGAHDAARLEGALCLYVGDLLEGFYEEWILAERERLRRLHLECLTWLMRHHGARGGYERACAFGHEVLGREPFREEVHRELMRLYLDAGQRGLAARQYEMCRVAVHQHLETEPTSETRALFDRAVRGSGGSGPRPPSGSQGLEDRLEAAIRRFDEARDELRRAVHLVLRARGGEGEVPMADRGYSMAERLQVSAVTPG